MADAMCGPSNALQQFKQQTDVDRSLHQDRFSSRQHPSQSFRSQNSAGPLLDPEFEAFQAGLDAPLLEHAQTFHPPTGFAASSHNPSWASDFQRMNISSPPPTQQQHFQPGPSTADWAHGFRDQFAQAAPKAQASASSPLAFQQRARGIGNFGFQSSFAQSNYAPAVQSKGIQPVVVDQFDEAAFERAFDMAREDMMADVEETTQSETIEELAEKVEAATQQEATQMLNETAQDIPEQTVNDIVHRIHSSDIEYEPHEILKEEEMLDQQPRNDDDALAATAQELLEKIEHNQSDKFKNSQFLGLMRKLRDREVRVEGDQMVETVSPTYDFVPVFPNLHTSTNPPVINTVPDDDVSDHEFDHWESPYT